MSWAWNAVSGVYSNHAMSEKIREEGIGDSLFMKFITPEPGYGKKKGESITITRILQLPLAGRVSETERLPSGRPAVETGSVTVSEWGYMCETTEFEENLTFFDLRNKFQKMLRDQITLTMDKMVADVAKTTQLILVPHDTSGDDSAFETDGAPSVQANINLGVTHLRMIHDKLRNIKCPPFRNGQYIGILSTRCARGIKNDSEYKDWQAPTTSEPLITGKLKSIEGFDLYETNNADSLADLAGHSTVCGEAVFFGDDWAFTAVIQDPELRAGIPQNLGRFREFGWVGTLDAGLTWPTTSARWANQRVIFVTSS